MHSLPMSNYLSINMCCRHGIHAWSSSEINAEVLLKQKLWFSGKMTESSHHPQHQWSNICRALTADLLTTRTLRCSTRVWAAKRHSVLYQEGSYFSFNTFRSRMIYTEIKICALSHEKITIVLKIALTGNVRVKWQKKILALSLFPDLQQK